MTVQELLGEGDHPFGKHLAELVKQLLREYNSLIFEADNAANLSEAKTYSDLLPSGSNELYNRIITAAVKDFDIEKLTFADGAALMIACDMVSTNLKKMLRKSNGDENPILDIINMMKKGK